MPTTVRPEAARDVPAIRRVEEAAFGRPLEADPVDALRSGGYVVRSPVAEVDGIVCGHVLVSPVTLAGPDGEWRATALGPLAADPDHQRRGVGTVFQGLRL